KNNFAQREAELTIESITEAKREKDSEVKMLQAKLAEMHVTDSAAVDKEAERAARVKEMLNGMDSAKAISRHEAGMGDLLRSLVEAGDDDSKKVEMVMQARRQLDEARDVIHERDAQIGELTQRHDDLAVQCADLDSKYERLLAEYEEMLEQSIVAEEQQDTRDTETINDLRQKLEDRYSDKLSSQRVQLETALSDLQRKQDEVSKAAASVRELRAENRELAAKLEQLSDASAKKSEPAAIAGGDVTAATEHAMLKEREMHAMRREMAQRILEYDTMRKSLMRDVQNRCEKIIELEMALDEARSQNAQLNRRNPNQPQRMQLLEKNVAQLTLMQKELVVQNTDLKKQVALCDRKLVARTERITYLETRLQDSNNQVEAWKRKAEELQSVRSQERAAPTSNNVLRFSRIAKPMRGGGGGGAPAAAAEEKTSRTGFFNWGSN
ncbi:hypothetical protein GGF43_000931, partial [Coemansia sp. RSA 2618]